MRMAEERAKLDEERKKGENKESLEKSKELQKNAVVEDHPSPQEAEKWRLTHKKALDICVKDENNVYRDPCQPIFIFYALNEEIQETGNPWLLSEEGYSPSSFTWELWLQIHFDCLTAWRKWRGNVPRPE